MKLLYALPLLLASSLYAAPEVGALTLDNGRNINGRNINGSSLNGRNINGRNMNGRNINGIALHGTGEDAAAKVVSVILKDGERIDLR